MQVAAAQRRGTCCVADARRPASWNPTLAAAPRDRERSDVVAGLENAGVGWDLDLAAPERWSQVLQQCVDLSADRYDALCTRAACYAREAIDVPAIDAAFDAALKASARAAPAKLTV